MNIEPHPISRVQHHPTTTLETLGGGVLTADSESPQVVLYDTSATNVKKAVESGIIPPRAWMVTDDVEIASVTARDQALSIYTWVDADPATRNQTYAAEFMNRLVRGGVNDYLKNGEARRVIERITDEHGNVTHLRLGMPGSVEGGWIVSKSPVATMRHSISTEANRYVIPEPTQETIS